MRKSIFEVNFPIFTSVLSIALLAFKTTVDRAGTVIVTTSFLLDIVGLPNRVFQPPVEVALVIEAFIAFVELLNATRYSRFSASSFFEITNSSSLAYLTCMDELANPGFDPLKAARTLRYLAIG